ncbi:MAG TPA: serine hydrolase domain-containing protein [Candidatus Competibacter sp.]|nr:serine hydrolase domain-containing protein [Candidatus Competibacter sp.]
MNFRWIPGLLFAAALAGCADQNSEPVRIGKGDLNAVTSTLTAQIEREMKREDIAGLSIALVDDQRIAWAQGFGWADIEAKRPATPDTLYRVGSVSKLFTALELLKLRDAGKLKLDRPVTAFLPGFTIRSRAPNPPPITLRALAAHHSGLPTDRLNGMWAPRPSSLATLVDELSDETLAAVPQTQYRYSNLGFSVLGRVIEVATGQPFEQAMEHDLLIPLGMKRSRFTQAPPNGIEVAVGYRKNTPLPWLTLRDAPAGGLTSSAVELAQLLKLVFADGVADGRRIVSAQSVADSLSPQFAGLPADFGHRVGLSWMLSGVQTATGDAVVWHDGAAPPFYAAVAMLPKDQLGVVVLSNSEAAGKISLQLATRALDLLKMTRQGGIYRPSPAVELPAVQLPPGEIERYAGDYVVFGQMLRVEAQGDRLKTTFQNTGLELVPAGAGRFSIRARVMGVLSFGLPNLAIDLQKPSATGLPDQSSDAMIGLVTGLPAPVTATRLPGVSIPNAWRGRLGSCDLDTRNQYFEIRECRFVEENGHLVLRASIRGTETGAEWAEFVLPLVPLNDTEAIVPGYGAGEGGTARAVALGNVETLRYSGFEIRLLRDRR